MVSEVDNEVVVYVFFYFFAIIFFIAVFFGDSPYWLLMEERPYGFPLMNILYKVGNCDCFPTSCCRIVVVLMGDCSGIMLFLGGLVVAWWVGGI